MKRGWSRLLSTVERAAPAAFAALMALPAHGAAPAPAPGFQILYAFGAKAGFADGAHPEGLVSDKAGNLYGTVCCGGGNGYGAIYRLAPGGTETVLYSFSGGDDGAFPEPGLARDPHGRLYGTTSQAGANGGGTVFRLDEGGLLRTLHAFGGAGDGAVPNGDLIVDGKKNIYGSTYSGGAHGKGTVFRIARDGRAETLYSFGNKTGTHPVGAMLRDGAGNIFGTTHDGGGGGCSGGCGTVFELAADGEFRTVYAFRGGSDGAGPQSNLVMDAAGNLYGGTDRGGGQGCDGPGCGVVFKVTADGQETVLHAFAARSEGAQPYRFAFDKTGRLFGETFAGGGCRKDGCGIVFMLNADGTLETLHQFTGGSDGSQPNGLIAGRHGSLLGTAQNGGDHAGGVVFEIAP
jgi:uncharacterized repeat protein (TIGR03803 family)